MFLVELIRALASQRVTYALVGGYAVNLHGLVRGTLDIDLALRFRERDFVKAEQAFRSLGLEPRLPVRAVDVFHFRQEYIDNRNLTAWTFVNPREPNPAG